MNAKLTGIRTAAAAGGVALLMALSACGGSDDQKDDASVEQDAGSGGAEQTDDAVTNEENEAGAGESDAEGAEETTEPETGGGDGSVAAPAEDFDPCTVLTGDDISQTTGLELGDGKADEIMGSTTCTFAADDGSGMAMVQWAAVEGDFEATLDAATGSYENVSDVEELDIPGATQASGFTGELMGFEAAGVLAQLDGGFMQVIVGGDGVTVDTATDVTAMAIDRS